MMKKYIVLTALTLTLTGGLLAGCGSGNDIGQDAAKEAAFADAQVSEDDTSRLRVSKDRDDGRSIYEVEFTVGNTEYNYDIDASDGSILTTETEEVQGSASTAQSGTQNSTTQTQDDSQDAAAQQGQETAQSTDTQTDQTQAGQSAQNTQNGQNSGGTANVAVSEADARAAALERVSGATDSDIRMELDYDDGQYIYEGDIIYNGKEYEFEIDANTGNFLKWSEERD